MPTSYFRWPSSQSSSVVLSIGALDGNGAVANGASILNNTLYLQSASLTEPGLVNNASQSFSGDKTFSGAISASNLSGTNTGDVTLTAVGSSPSANAASLTGQVLTLQPADATHPGVLTIGAQTIGGAKTFASTISASNLSGTNTGDVSIGTANGLSLSSQALSLALSSTSTTGALSSTDWNTFNGKQASGSYLTALTGDVTASGPGSAATSIAKIQGTTVSGTTGSGNVVLSSAPTLANPVVGTQSQGDASTKAASTAYVDTAVANAVAGVNPAVAVQAATTSASDTSSLTYTHVAGIGDFFTGPPATALVVDGFTFTALGQRLLVKNDTQSPSGAFNGVYSVTQLQALGLGIVLTRALDFDTPSDINNTGAIPVINGTVNGTTQWVVSSSVVTVGTTPIIFTQFAKNPADYLLKANNLSDVAAVNTALNNLLPAQTSNTGKFLQTDGTDSSWATPSVTFTAPTQTVYTTGSGTYTLPSPAPLYLEIIAVGGGGGGGGGGTVGSPGTDGSAGTATTFGTALLVAAGGNGGGGTAAPGAGGTASLGSGPIGDALVGQSGGTGSLAALTGGALTGGMGGGVGGGAGGNAGAGIAASNALTNSGGGGGGASPTTASLAYCGGGGGEGGKILAIISSPNSTYSYAVGSGGSGGVAGTSGNAGGDGADGRIVIRAYYQ